MNRIVALKGLASVGAALSLAVAAIAVSDGSTAADEAPPAATAGPSPTSTSASPTTAAPTSTSTTSTPPPTTTTTAPPDTTTSTTRPPAPATTTSTTTAPPTPPAGDRSDPDLRRLQQRLADLGYDVGPVDGVAGARTTAALTAFQKVEGLTRDGRPGPEVEAALAGASSPGPLVPAGAPTRIEVDLARQVLLYWEDGALARILPVSTGSGLYYCNPDGTCEYAVTPTGAYRIGRRHAGPEVAPLGTLYHPMYFNRGIAIHGSPTVPPYPDSHGCVRIPMYAAASFYDQVATGTPVHVVAGGAGTSSAGASAAAPAPDGAAPTPDEAPPADGMPPEESPVPGKV